MAEILIIDDDDNIHEIVPLFLQQAGHATHSAMSGPQGIQLAARIVPDLILLDLAMPLMDGWETLKTLKENPATADIPVLIFTVHDPADAAMDADTAGCAGYIKKPVHMQPLQDSVARALANRSASAR